MAVWRYRVPTEGGTGERPAEPMIRIFLDTIADLWRAPDAWIAAELEFAPSGSDPTPVHADGPFRSQFLDLARQRQRANGPMVAGLLSLAWQVPRLSAIGARHSDMKALTAMVAEVVLQQMADRPDFVLQYDADTFLVCFASGSPAVPEIRIAMMAQALEAALLARIPNLDGRLRIDHVVTTLNPAAPVRRYADIGTGLASILRTARDSRPFGPAIFQPMMAKQVLGAR